jgi:hypothetical protein
LAVRARAARLAPPTRPPHPALNTPDDAQRPSCERGMRGEKHGFLENGRGISLRAGLDRANQVEIVGENRGFAQKNRALPSKAEWTLRYYLGRLFINPTREDVGVCDVRVTIRTGYQAGQPARPPRASSGHGSFIRARN